MVADVRWQVILQELEDGGEIAGQEVLPDKEQHILSKVSCVW